MTTMTQEFGFHPQESLPLREQRLARGAQLLRMNAIGSGGIALSALALALLGAILFGSDLFFTAQNLLLARHAGPADVGLAIVVLLGLINVSASLVLLVGVLARELWAPPALMILILLNGAALALLGYTPGLLSIALGMWAAAVLLRDLRAFRINPVMLKELRGRMRGVRAFLVLSVYLALMSGFAVLIYLVYSSVGRSGSSAAAGEVGRVLFMGVFGIELLLIIFIAPAFTAGAITGERERQTYDLLRTTLLSSPSFVIGKLESALGYVLLLLLAAIPLQSIAFLFGGVSELELLLSFVILVTTAVVLGAVGIFFSATMTRTLAASVRAYTAIVMVMFVGPVVFSVLLDILIATLFAPGSPVRSPLLEAVMRYLSALLVGVNPIATALSTQQLLVERQTLGFWTFTLTSDGSTIPMVSPWILYTIIYQAAAALLVVLAVRRARAGDLT
jgi:ABC-2 type transport system permease protein